MSECVYGWTLQGLKPFNICVPDQICPSSATIKMCPENNKDNWLLYVSVLRLAVQGHEA